MSLLTLFKRKKKLKDKIDQTFRRIGFYADLGELIDIPDYIGSEEWEGGFGVVYRLPIGIQPKKIQDALAALQMSLESTLEHRIDGRMLIIEGFNRKLPDYYQIVSNKEKENQMEWKSFVTKGEIAPIVNIGISQKGMESIDYSKIPNPFMLIGSAPGMGKSNALNVICPQLLFQGVDLYIGDPKLDFTDYQKHCNHESEYDEITYMVEEVSQKVKSRQKWINAKGYKNILEYNANEKEKMEFIFLIVDEIADFDPGDENFWEPVTHIVRKGRSAGVYMIMATQRASTDMFSSTVKSNILLRLAFKTSTVKNSEIILESNSAFHLPTIPGRGVLLNGLEREIQVPYISTKQVRTVLNEIQKGTNH